MTMPRKYAILRDCSDGIHTYSLFNEQGSYTGSMMKKADLPLDTTKYMLEENSRCARCEVIPPPEEHDGYAEPNDEEELHDEDRILQEYNWGTRL
jgi:hypothetical protein